MPLKTWLSIAWLSTSRGVVAHAAPLLRDEVLQARLNENVYVMTGEPARDRTIFVVVAIVCATILAFMLGSSS